MTEETPDKEKSMDATSAPEPGAARPARPRLVRSTSDRKIAGVAGGLAEHLNIDPLIVRLAFVASVFAGGLGLLLYLGGWVLIPEEGDEDREPPVLTRIRELPWLALVLFIVGGGLLLSQVADWDGGATFWGLLLIGIGVLLFREEKEDPSDPGDSGPGPASLSEQPTLPIASERGRVQRAIARRPKRERSLLGRYTFAAMLIVVGGVALLDYAGAFTLEAGQYPALALAVVGVGLLAGTFWGRSRSLIVLGLCIAPFALAGSLVDVPLEGGWGERVYSPTSADAVHPEYHLTGGVMRFDLTDVRWGAEPVEIDATVAFGEIEVRVPDDVRVELDGSVGAGAIDFFDSYRSGYEVELEAVGGDPDATKTLIIRARTSIGSLDVDRPEFVREVEGL